MSVRDRQHRHRDPALSHRPHVRNATGYLMVFLCPSRKKCSVLTNTFQMHQDKVVTDTLLLQYIKTVARRQTSLPALLQAPQLVLSLVFL
jgi:hypothetical protein